MKRIIVRIVSCAIVAFIGIPSVPALAREGPPEVEFTATCTGPGSPGQPGSVVPGQTDACDVVLSRGFLDRGTTVLITVTTPAGVTMSACDGGSASANSCTFSLPGGAAQGQRMGGESFPIPAGTAPGTAVRQQARVCTTFGCTFPPVTTTGPGSVVGDAPVSVSGFTFNAMEGHTFGGTVAQLSDADRNARPQEYTAMIDWGDGTGSTPGTLLGWSIWGSHAYVEEGTYVVTVTVQDSDFPSNGAVAQDPPRAVVADAPLSADGRRVNSTNPVTGVIASFTDSDPNGTVADYNATINWGDGATTSGTVRQGSGAFDVTGTHTYAQLGQYIASVHVCDAGGACADATSQILVYDLSAGGNFVIGDGNAALGAAVTFWSAQWASANTLSGGPAPSSFKGFANDPAAAPACASTWSANPGGSSNPPPTIPTYVAVVVASSISKHGPHITGDSVEVVVVKTDPGYGPDPGSPGAGTVVAVLCP